VLTCCMGVVQCEIEVVESGEVFTRAGQVVMAKLGAVPARAGLSSKPPTSADGPRDRSARTNERCRDSFPCC
jgi:hypothetical protein